MDEHQGYMQIALDEARKAFRDGEFPVGCVIVYEGRVVSTGSRVNSTGDASELDHAEIVALRNLQNQRPNLDLRKVTVYSTMEPCLMCFSTMIVNNVRRVVYSYEDVMGGGTNLPLHLLSPLYASLDIAIIGGVMRSESLLLFQQFFNAPSTTYLKDTLLARYTLEQSL